MKTDDHRMVEEIIRANGCPFCQSHELEFEYSMITDTTFGGSVTKDEVTVLLCANCHMRAVRSRRNI